MTGQLESLPDDQLKVVNQGLTYLLIILPLSLIIFGGFYIYDAHSQFETMVEIRNQLEKFDLQKREVLELGRNLVGQSPVSSKEQLNTLIQSAASLGSLSMNKITISGGSTEDPSGGIQKTTGSLRFKKFSSKEFSDLINALSVSKKIQISRIETNLNEKKSILSGSMDLIYYAKAPGN